MQEVLIHYGPFKRNEGLDRMIQEQVATISEHLTNKNTKRFQVWLDRLKSSSSRHGVSYRCKIEVRATHGKSYFVDKHAQNLFGAINRARRAVFNLLDHSLAKPYKRRQLHKSQKVHPTNLPNMISDNFQSEPTPSELY